MLLNYIKIAFRNMVHQKLYSGINIVGLAIGIGCCLLIFLFVRNELSYDKFHQNAENIYRVYVTEDPPDRDAFTYVQTPALMAEAMEKSFPEVESAVRVLTRTDNLRFGDKNFSENYHLVDSDFFEIFSFPLIAGNPSTVLQNLNSVVLTESMASKIFGSTDILNQTLSIKLGNAFHDFTITGIAKDCPTNSSIQFSIAIPFDNARSFMRPRALTSWFNVFLETYVVLSAALAHPEMESKLEAVVKNNYSKEGADIVTLQLQSITDIHLNPDIPAGFVATSDPIYSTILSIVALLVLGIACINFMILSIGRSASRTKEVGVRKVLGALKSQLIKQFWGEAVLMSFIAMVLGTLLAIIFLPYFNEIANKQLAFAVDFFSLAIFAFLILLVAITAGSYPAFILSRFQPAEVVKGESKLGGTKLFGRSLVVVQFTISIFLIVSTLIMLDQIEYLQTKNLGFNDEQVLVIRNNSPAAQGKMLVERLRNQLANKDAVLSVSGASATFASPWTIMGFRDNQAEFKQFYQITVDHDYLQTLEIELADGRDFSKDFATDSTDAVIVNQAMVKFFNWQSPLGQSFPGKNFPPHQIIGVVKDFNFQSLQNEIAPLAIVLNPMTLLRGINDISTSFSPRSVNFINVRIQPDRIPQTIDLVKSAWQSSAANQPFQFSFLDEDVDQQYREEERWGKIVGYASSFAILIACLGLFGLATLTVARRTKEIGIRKVLGANVSNILFMLTNDFGKLVIIGTILAWPIAYFAMRNWLEDFAYRIGIGIENFILATAFAILIALVAIGYQSIKAALENPVKSIKYE
ncbi:ABC transporter permease [candidate division KSB1 bacterium]|nr:ABC transporter permease [candidate division KSB1 bacterium]